MIIDAVVALLASVYAIFYNDFTPTFISFLALMVAWIAPWCGVVVVDAWLRRETYNGSDLLRAEGGRYWYGNGWRGAAYIAWIAGAIASLASTNAQLFVSPLVPGLLGGADFSVLAGLLVSAVLYWLLANRTVTA